jgi:hypothetical protein
MSNQRKTIRDAVAAVISAVVTCPVFTSRNTDARDETEFVTAFFESGEIEYDGLAESTTAQLSVVYRTEAVVDDDAIDVVADAIHAALVVADIAPSVAQGFFPIGWEYSADKERAFSGINLRYTVIY